MKINNSRYSIFFDSGCADFVSRHNAILSLTSNATQEHAGPITMGGVGGVISVSQHVIYKVNLPLYDGSQATVSGVCLDNITLKFPLYPLQGKVLNDITKPKKDAGGRCRNSSKNTKVSRWGNRLHNWYQVPQLLPEDDIPITIRTDHL